jgi:putative nucleotidyltransferase with HDIG domain
MAMEMRDPYTAGHQTRVARIAVEIATEMGWSAERIVALRLAAQIHDIGKISVPSEILSKPGRLSANERALLNEHTQNGYNILKGIPFPWPIATIVLQHHEKLDGSGYPEGLKGDQILPEARILTVADMLEAMVSHRPYRPGHPIEAVFEQLLSESGTKLDPDVLNACTSLYRSGRLDEILADSKR